MAKRKNIGGVVYSTDPLFKIEEEQSSEQPAIAPAQQLLKVKLDTRNRGGKAVTLVENYIGPQTEKEELGKKLKTFCGTGGAVKGDEILIQGDHRDKILQWLIKQGFMKSKKI